MYNTENVKRQYGET